MTFFPIIERELRVRARARSTFWMRVAVGLVSLLIALPSFTLGSPTVAPATAGKSISTSIFVAAFILSCCAFFLTISSIQREQREGTLGLLVLTRVRLLDVLLGKLGAIGLATFTALMAFSPILMLPVLAGGVTGGEAFRQGLVLLNTAFLSSAVGLFASAGEVSFARAARRAGALVIVIVVVTAVFWTLSNELRFVGLLSPLVSLLCAAEGQYKLLSSLPYWVSLALAQAIGWAFLGAALIRLRGAVREPAVVRRTRTDFRAIPAASSRSWQPRAGHANPIEWFVRRQPGVLPAVWAAAVVDLVMRTWLFGAFFVPGGVLLYTVPSLISSILTGALISWAASRFFIEARQTGTLETLMTTPAGATSVVSGQWHALQRLLFWPVIVMLLPVVVQALLMMSRRFGAGMPPALSSILYGPVSVALQVLNTAFSIAALVWLGLFYGYRARNQAAAVCWSVVWARGIPYLLSWATYAITFPLFRKFSGSSVPWSVAYTLIPSMDILCFLFLIILVNRRLTREVRRAEAKTLGESLKDTRRMLSRALHKARDWPPTAA